MPKVINRGPTHRIEVDDKVLELNAKEGIDLTQDQIDRIRAADPDVQLEGAPEPKAPAATTSGGTTTTTGTPPATTGGST